MGRKWKEEMEGRRGEGPEGGREKDE